MGACVLNGLGAGPGEVPRPFIQSTVTEPLMMRLDIVTSDHNGLHLSP